MNKLKRSDEGYSTIEATISLVFFLLAIMFIYSQIKVVIAENIMQNAVNNMAKEVSSYVYVLDKLEMILKHKDDEGKAINTAIGDAKNTVDDCVANLKDIFGGNDDMVASLEKCVDDLKTDAAKVKTSVDDIDKDNIKDLAVLGGESIVKAGSNLILSSFYEMRVEKYLPMTTDKFCKYFNINMKDGKSPFSFDASRVFPSIDNNSVLVAVTYYTESPVKFIPLKRKICKYAYTAAWVSSNAHEIKESSGGRSTSLHRPESSGSHGGGGGRGR